MADEKRVEVKIDPPKEGAFDITEGETVYATDKAPFHKEGAEIYVSKPLSESMIAKGYASKEKPKVK